MRPLKITMTAFGPYKDKETIDFAELHEHRLFVVSGNTGAGKTSIFDAICFALYGEASGEDRSDPRMLRSHFADDEAHTSVAFDFALNGRSYRVLRQLAHVREGNKNATGDKYEFYETTNGQETPMTDRFIVSQVNERIQEIIGLTKEQFSQIVMLPQGEFRKLLTSETENKEEILRRIFKTNLYKIVAELLNDKRRAAQKTYEERVHVRELLINQVQSAFAEREGSLLSDVFRQEHYNSFQVMEALEKEIGYYSKKTAEEKVKLEAETKSFKQITEFHHQVKGLNEQFDALQAKVSKREALEREIPEIERKSQELELAEKIVSLQVYERHVAEMIGEAEEKQKRHEAAQADSVQAEAALKEAKVRYEAEEAKIGQREQAARELDRLRGLLPTVKEIDAKTRLLQQLEQEASVLTAKLQSVERELKAKQADKLQASTEIKRLDGKVRSLPERSDTLAQLREKALVLRDYIKLSEDAARESAEEQKLRRISEQAAAVYMELEARWIEGQAGVLAEHLQDGRPCPVCGSPDHPMTAKLSSDVPTKEALEQKRHEKAEAERSYHTIKAKLDVTSGLLKEKESQMTAFGFPLRGLQDQYNALAVEGKALAEEVRVLKEEGERLDQSRKAFDELEIVLEAKMKEKEELSAQLHAKQAAHAAENARYEQGIAGIPEDIRSLGRLEQRILDMEERKTRLEAEWKQVQESYHKANDRTIAAKSASSAADSQLKEALEKQEKAVSSFTAALRKAGFATEEAYRHAKRSDAEREALQAEIESFKTELSAIRKQIEELELALKDKRPVDLSVLAEQKSEIERQLEQTRTAYMQAQHMHEKAVKVRTELAQTEQTVKAAEEQFQTVRDLYDVVRGENGKKISFERYLQIEFLESIVHAANQRLLRISGGQYQLVRSDRLEKRGRQSGLGLDVYDNYTGQMRDVKTLSGGEKFNASLCLALGMADVIQSYEGGISIETMFIDEGFGSLDEESLNKAIDTLIDLQQSGRMIGIISHVQELKQAIPAVLEVKKTREGYSQTRFVVS